TPPPAAAAPAATIPPSAPPPAGDAAAGRGGRGTPPPPPPPPPAVMPKPVEPIVSGTAPSPDPRVGLRPGRWDAAQAAWNMRLLSTTPPKGRTLGATHSDLAFSGNLVIQGNYNGFDIYDISNPSKPVLMQTYLCPASQNDVSVYRNLLFMSSEATNSRADCGFEGVPEPISKLRVRGILQGRPGPPRNEERAAQDQRDREAAAAAAAARGERGRGAGAPGAAPGGGRGPQGPPTGPNQCHDITVYPEIGLAGGACAGLGLLLDIHDAAHPFRIDMTGDSNMSFWHSATFNNDGTKVLFSDEWGGGSQPRCRATDKPEWGADALFTIENKNLVFHSYYKMPAPQTDKENCVAHNGSLIPIPGR